MIVYYYCDMNTFHTIATKRTIRLSDITKSNDSMEILWMTQYIKDIFLEMFDKEKTQYFQKNYPKTLFIELLDHYQSEFFDVSHCIYSHYVCCFSEHDDLLSQWRGYADDGKGVAIGFDSDLLSSIGLPAKDDPSSSNIIYFGKVEYSDYNQKQTIRKAAQNLIEDLKSIVKSNSKGGTSSIKRQSLQIFNKWFLWLFNQAVFMKSSFFKEETEYRICHWIYNRSDDPKIEKTRLENEVYFDKFSFQNRKGKLVSYFDLCFDKSPLPFISEVIIGPKSIINEPDIKKFLANNKMTLTDGRVRKSKGSYR